MSDFHAAWLLSRSRFVEVLEGKSQAQLTWRMRPGTLTLAEAALHVAGAEVNFASLLTDQAPEGLAAELRRCVVEGVIDPTVPFPIPVERQTPELLSEALEIGRSMIEPVLLSTDPTIRSKSFASPLGPAIDGTGTLARMAFHCAYHQGQAHWLTADPGFPVE